MGGLCLTTPQSSFLLFPGLWGLQSQPPIMQGKDSPVSLSALNTVGMGRSRCRAQSHPLNDWRLHLTLPQSLQSRGTGCLGFIWPPGTKLGHTVSAFINTSSYDDHCYRRNLLHIPKIAMWGFLYVLHWIKFYLISPKSVETSVLKWE